MTTHINENTKVTNITLWNGKCYAMCTAYLWNSFKKSKYWHWGDGSASKELVMSRTVNDRAKNCYCLKNMLIEFCIPQIEGRYKNNFLSLWPFRNTKSHEDVFISKKGRAKDHPDLSKENSWEWWPQWGGHFDGQSAWMPTIVLPSICC